MLKGIYQSMAEQIMPDNGLIEKTKEKMLRGKTRTRWEKRTVACGVAAACVCVAALVGIFTLGGGKGANSMRINIIEAYEEGMMAKLYFDPATTHEEVWSRDQMLEYLGRDPMPAVVPQDLTLDEQMEYFVVLNNDGTMNYGSFPFSYSAAGEWTEESRTLFITVAKGELSPTCIRYLEDEQTKSEINGNPLAIGHEAVPVWGEDGQPTEKVVQEYRAEFLYDGLGYRLTARNLTQEEFIVALESILQPLR